MMLGEQSVLGSHGLQEFYRLFLGGVLRIQPHHKSPYAALSYSCN